MTRLTARLHVKASRILSSLSALRADARRAGRTEVKFDDTSTTFATEFSRDSPRHKLSTVSQMQASPEYNPEGNPEQTTAVHAVAVPHPSGARQSDGVGVMDSKSTSDGTGGKRRVWPWLLGLVVLAVTLLSIVVLRTRQSTDSKSAAVEAMPTNAPTSPGDEECLKKRVKIKQVCNVPGLDDKLVEMKVLVDDKLYWPRNVRADCTAEYGSDGTSCVVPESTLSSGCVVLKNSREIAFGGPDGAAVTERIKVTIMDEDFFWDDVVDVFVPKEDWHRPNLCEKKEIEVAQSSHLEAAKVVLGIDFGEVQNACGVDEKVLSSGLTDAALALQNVQEGLVEYVRGLEGRALRRKLIFPLLASGFRLMASGGRSFVRLFTRQSRVSNVLSTAADMTEIGSFILSFFGDDDEAPSVEGIDNQALFDRFDQIDSQLENIQLQIQDGLDEIKLVVEQEFAEQELDEWVKFRLGVRLRGDYKVSDESMARTPCISR